MARGLVALVVLVGLVLGGREVLGGGEGAGTGVARGEVSSVVSVGAWAHRADPEDLGLAAGWGRNGVPGARSVRVPGVPAAVEVGGEAGARTFAGSVGWWQGALRVPSAGRYAVRFGSVSHRADVWIGGRRACAHVGAYEPFDCRVRLARAGAHRVVLRADSRDPEKQAREGFDRAWFHFGGPAWAITARALPDAEPQLAAVDTRLRGRTARVTFAVIVRDTRPAGGPVRRRLRGELEHGDRRIALPARDLTLTPGAFRRVRLTVAVRDPRLWSPQRPALHTLRLSATAGARPVVHRVGLRELRREGPRLLLNGEPLRLRGVGLPPDARGHGDALTARDRRAIVAQVRATGANAVRSQHPLSDELLGDLDAAGILVWQLVGPFDKAGRFWAQTPAKVARARARVLATVDRQGAHPSIVAWSLSNELAGQGHPEGQAAYIDRMARELRGRTPGVLVAADVWGAHPPRFAGPAFTNLDAVGLTEYVGLTELAGAPAAQQDARATQGIDRLRAILPDTAIVVTEFGANGNEQNPVDSPGGHGYQSDLLRRRIALYAARPDVAGMLVWTLRDYAVSPGFSGGSLRRALPDLRLSGPLSEKGLFRYDGTPKPAVAAVRRAFAAADR